MSQTPYLPILIPSVDNLVAITKAATKELYRQPFLLAFIASQQPDIIGMLPEGVLHATAAVLQTYV